MSSEDVNVIMSKLEIMDYDIKDLKGEVKKLRDASIESKSKRLECEDHFDKKYVAKIDFKAFWLHEWNNCQDNKFGKIKDFIWLINLVVIILLALTQIF